MPINSPQVEHDEWVTFPGGQLEGRRPKALCQACRDRLRQAAASGSSWTPTRQHARQPKDPSHPLCFQCYRAGFERERALKAAGELDTASIERFQAVLPLKPVDEARLEMLKIERAASRAIMADGTARFVEKRHRAQIAARHALQTVADGLRARGLAVNECRPVMASAIHAAELQLPAAWLPFVTSR